VSDASTIRRLAEQGVTIWGEGSRLRYRAAKGALTQPLRDELIRDKDRLLAAWRTHAAQVVEQHPASYGQRALWFIHQSLPESASYNVVFSARLRSKVDLGALRGACQALVDRHPSLRTTFAMDRDRLVQRVHGSMGVPFEVRDRSAADLEALRAELLAASHLPFSLEDGPPIRVHVLARAEDDHFLLLTVHHIAADGWSLFLLLDDLKQLYASEAGAAATLPRPRPLHDVAEFARWQREMLASDEGRAHEAYWLQTLAGDSTPLTLPTDRPRGAVASNRGATHAIDLGRDLSESVQSFANREGATPYMVLLAAYQVLLYRYTGQPDVIVGSPTYGRDRSEFADVVGDFINMVPLNATFANDRSFRDFVADTRRTVLGAMQHQDYPFPLLVEKLQPDRSAAHTPVFQTLFVLQKFKQLAGFEDFFSSSGSELRSDAGGLVLSPFAIPQQEGQFELSLDLVENDGVYQGTIKYDTELHDRASIERLASHYRTLLNAAVGAPETMLSRLPLMEHAQLQAVVAVAEQQPRSAAREGTVVDFIAAQVARTPDVVAVSFDGRELTYREIDELSDRVAGALRARGAAQNAPIGVMLPRSPDLLVALLGVLKAGAAYLPLDPRYPLQRRAFMLADSDTAMVVTDAAGSKELEGRFSRAVFRIRDLAAEARAPAGARVDPRSLAYVIYTSGSTGQPKGVEIEHIGVANFLASMRETPGLEAGDRVLAITTVAFDIAVLELFLPLTVGATIVMASEDVVGDPVRLAALIAASGTTVLQATPATWRLLIGAGWKGDGRLKALCGGEALSLDLANQLLDRCGSLWNLYGPTETTVWSAVHRVEKGASSVPLGRPIANTQLYVLDTNAQPLPIGVPGELWIGGDGVARGYHARPDLDAQRFAPNAFVAGGRAYRTGDRVRCRSDGLFDFLGRLDFQVKIRGFRIELGEIEAVLRRHASLREAVVVARDDRDGEPRLVAYWTPTCSAPLPTVSELRAFVGEALPYYMVPSSFVELEALPLTKNGKIDRKALPEPDTDRPSLAAAFVQPATATERTLADIWAHVLGLERVGIRDNFFDLGGTSLLLVQLQRSLNERLGSMLPLVDLFRYPTIAALAARLDVSGADTSPLRAVESRAALQKSALAAAEMLAERRWRRRDGPP
jgi:amino acid adenylation domain-containing protein